MCSFVSSHFFNLVKTSTCIEVSQSLKVWKMEKNEIKALIWSSTSIRHDPKGNAWEYDGNTGWWCHFKYHSKKRTECNQGEICTQGQPTSGCLRGHHRKQMDVVHKIMMNDKRTRDRHLVERVGWYHYFTTICQPFWKPGQEKNDSKIVVQDVECWLEERTILIFDISNNF